VQRLQGSLRHRGPRAEGAHRRLERLARPPPAPRPLDMIGLFRSNCRDSAHDLL
jgi:hypothetical protein